VKPRRADASANRDRILQAADEVFGAGGSAASTEDVAKRAGVGIATVFRHFPTKHDLLAAVLIDRLERLAVQAEELVGADDPGGAFRRFFTDVVEGAATKVTIAEALTDVGTVPDGVGEASRRLRKAFAGLLARAQAAGAVRSDVAAPEVYALMVGTSRAVVHLDLTPPVESRLVALALDALR
jgi:AcrR family transcriptional regulator